MSMYLVGKRICPSCGVKGRRWKENRDVLICPSCKTFFNEFGVILESKNKREDALI